MSDTDKVRMAVIGAGRTGTPLIENLLEIPYIELVGVCDLDPEAPGAQLAKRYDVFFTQSVDELAARGEEIDMIIEVTGNPEVKPRLKEIFIEQGNKTTVILHDIVARLVLSIATGSNTLLHTYHPDDTGIG